MSAGSRRSLPGMLAIVLFPFLVYFSIDRVGLAPLGVVLVLGLLFRAWPFFRERLWWLCVASLAGLIYVLLLFASGNSTLLKLYPTGVSIFLLGVFASSLLFPPSLVQRFAVAAGMEVTPRSIAYTRNVTLLWCGFFLANILITSFIAVRASMEVWTLYNGFISYVLIGLIFLAEFVYRRLIFEPRLQNAEPPDSKVAHGGS